MTKFTNGPWKVQRDADAYTHIIRDEADVYIAATPQGTSQRVIADAELIAAAPSMYEALDAMIADAKAWAAIMHYHADGGEAHIKWNSLERAEFALKLARGEGQ